MPCDRPWRSRRRRGWTLQELIAPSEVYFYDLSWNYIGEKGDLAKQISQITGIDADVLRDHRLMHNKSIARRMSWASTRETTRTGDIVYCLMGIFNFNIPLLYGEGEKAFFRLQKEIMQTTYDHSLFAWAHHFPNTLYGTGISMNGPLLGVGALAPHPVAFSGSADVVPHLIKSSPYAISNRGLETQLRLLENEHPSHCEGHAHTHLAILQCGYKNSLGTAIGIPLTQISASQTSESGNEYCRVPNQDLAIVTYSQARDLAKQKLYLLDAGPLSTSRESYPVHRCWLREFGYESGVKFHKALYCPFPLHGGEHTSCCWNYTDKSMTWKKGCGGVRAVLLFSLNSSVPFTVILTFVHLNTEGRTGVHIHLKQVQEHMKKSVKSINERVSLRQILDEHVSFEPTALDVDEEEAAYLFGSRVITARVQKEIVFDEDVFVLDLTSAGAKRRHSEVTPDG